MSGYDGKRRAREVATDFDNGQQEAGHGQSHDRIQDDVYLVGPPDPYLPGRDHNGDIELTVTQKMLSAMSGSLLTSLIGNANTSYLTLTTYEWLLIH
jgi:hypothetical protein